MKIAIVTSNPLHVVSGLSRFNYYLSKVFSEAGHSVRLFDGTVVDGIPRSLFVATERLSRGVASKPVLSIFTGRKFMRVSDGYDLAICNGMFGFSVNFHPSINVYHGTMAGWHQALRGSPRNRKLRGYLRWLVERRLDGFFEARSGRGKLIVALTEYEKEELSKFYGLRTHAVIGLGVDTQIFRPLSSKDALRREFGLPRETFLGLYVGRWEYGKGADVIERIAGGLDDGTKIVCLTNRRVLGKNIISLGRLPFHGLPSLYSACDFLLFPSRYEGFGFAILEAMACGLPVISFKTGFGNTLASVKGVGDFVVNSHDPSEYLLRIQLAKKDKAEFQEVGTRARRYVLQNNSLPQFGEKYLDTAERIVST